MERAKGEIIVNIHLKIYPRIHSLTAIMANINLVHRFKLMMNNYFQTIILIKMRTKAIITKIRMISVNSLQINFRIQLFKLKQILMKITINQINLMKITINQMNLMKITIKQMNLMKITIIQMKLMKITINRIKLIKINTTRISKESIMLTFKFKIRKQRGNSHLIISIKLISSKALN